VNEVDAEPDCATPWETGGGGGGVGGQRDRASLYSRLLEHPFRVIKCFSVILLLAAVFCYPTSCGRDSFGGLYRSREQFFGKTKVTGGVILKT
jgi:hypothetical protein